MADDMFGLLFSRADISKTTLRLLPFHTDPNQSPLPPHIQKDQPIISKLTYF
jgi:hypothetical protein